jgi:protein tyrosine phosphatase
MRLIVSGRTGSFVAIEMICHKLLKESKGDFSTVELMRDLRNKRALAIQNDQVEI